MKSSTMVGAENVTVTDVAGEGEAVVGSKPDARTNNNDARVWIKPCTIILPRSLPSLGPVLCPIYTVCTLKRAKCCHVAVGSRRRGVKQGSTEKVREEKSEVNPSSFEDYSSWISSHSAGAPWHQLILKSS